MDSCPIALPAISDFIPRLKEEVLQKLEEKPKYKRANLTVRTGDDGRVRWGGIGRRSLRLDPEDNFFTELNSRRIYYSLDTFFQANLSILPGLITVLEQMPVWKDAVFFDLYGGVGLFSLALYDLCQRVVLVESSVHSASIALYHKELYGLDRLTILPVDVEALTPDSLTQAAGQAGTRVAMVDPPRAGLSGQAASHILHLEGLDHLFYLSCHPESLKRDLDRLSACYQALSVTPLDFFPQTPHIETLVHFRRKYRN